MGRRGFLTFLAALIPGVGYMYLGLIKRGVQALVLFLLIEPLFNILGIGGLSYLVQIPFGCFTFFDTLYLARRIDMGERVEDTDFIFSYHNFSDFSKGGVDRMRKRALNAAALILIALGVLAIVHNLFGGTELYRLVMHYVRSLFMPVLLILAGVYILIRKS